MLAKALSDTLIYTVKPQTEVSSDLLVSGFAIKPIMEEDNTKIGDALKVDASFRRSKREEDSRRGL